MSKLNNMRRELESEFQDALHVAFSKKFGAEIKTEFNLFSMQTVSTRIDGQDFTLDEHAYIQGWSEGYNKAVCLVLMRDNDDEYRREMKRQAKESA